jgi:hypothetical protein
MSRTTLGGEGALEHLVPHSVRHNGFVIDGQLRIAPFWAHAAPIAGNFAHPYILFSNKNRYYHNPPGPENPKFYS